MKIREYSVPVVRILNQWQVTLYATHNLKAIDYYVSYNDKKEYKLVFVFDREKSQELFKKFRNHELEVGNDVLPYDM